jgi:formylglycine-generating enzyme required for sulfatase activity
VKNGSETDVDCGGNLCGTKCHAGQKCNASADCTTNLCAAGVCACPQGMKIVPIVGGGAYCIDITEVTYDQYEVFYNANPDTKDQPDWCKAWNTAYTPTANWPKIPPNPQGMPPSPGTGDWPVTHVDWCDAWSYCHYVGKHLCGAIGASGGGANDPANANDATKSEWFNACSAQGTSAYPYGPSYNATLCNGEVDPIAKGCYTGYPLTRSETQDPKCNNLFCVGGSPGLLNMSGNVAEWEDSCNGMTIGNAGKFDQCLARGGSYLSKQNELACASSMSVNRDYTGPDVGIRCCL